MILFIGALFTKGFTHDLLLEAGVFLVSVKLILMAYNSKQNQVTIMREFEELKALMKEAKDNLKQQNKL